MKKIWRDRWLAWLETPNRPQAIRQFYDAETRCYCALGGLCQLLIDRGVSNLAWSICNLPVVMPDTPQQPYLWSDEVCRITELNEGQINAVLALNDDSRRSFPEIAAWIRENVSEEV